MIDVSVIIVNYNTLELTSKCIESIKKNTKDIKYEIILLDNASSDGSVSYFRDCDDIIFIESTRNIGFGNANNLGYKYSKGKYIFFLNSDTILLNNAIKMFCDRMEMLSEEIACIGCRLLSPDLKFNHSFHILPSIKTTIINIVGLYLRFLGIKLKGYDERLYDNLSEFEVEYIIGADLFLRRSVIETCGLFDPDFFMYYEETELQYRYHKFGYKMMIITEPQIIHYECSSTNKTNKKYTFSQRYMSLISLFLYMKKRYSSIGYIFFRCLFIFEFPIFFASYYTLNEKILMLKLLFRFKNDFHQNYEN